MDASFLKSKPLLYGGLAVGAIALYWYMSSGSSGAASADTASGPSIDYPYSLVYGMGAAQVGGSGATTSTAPGSNDSSLGAGDAALLDLQSKQLALQSDSLHLNYNLSVLNSNNQSAVDMANIAATRDFNLAQTSARELDSVTSTFLASQSRNPRINGLTANVNGNTIGVTVVPQPTPNVSTIPRYF